MVVEGLWRGQSMVVGAPSTPGKPSWPLGVPAKTAKEDVPVASA